MRIVEVGHQGKGGGRPPVAYQKDYDFPTVTGARPGLFFRCNFNCDSVAVGSRYRKIAGIETDKGHETVLLSGYGFPTDWKGIGTGMINDIRSIKAMAAGCCPPELMIEFLREEREEAGAVEEAMKLHKRGSFGG